VENYSLKWDLNRIKSGEKISNATIVIGLKSEYSDIIDGFNMEV
jgi:hypothetical protein